MHSRPTIKDVAAQAGISRQTVSRVINNKGEISDATRARVLAAIEELGYRPSAAARSMVMGRTCTLGCISPNLTDFTFANIIEGAQTEARRLGYFILTGSAPTEADVEPLLEEMLRRQVDGLMVLNPRADGRYRHFLPLIDKGMAVVYLNNTPHGEPVSDLLRCRNAGLEAGPAKLGPTAAHNLDRIQARVRGPVDINSHGGRWDGQPVKIGLKEIDGVGHGNSYRFIKLLRHRGSSARRGRGPPARPRYERVVYFLPG